MIKKSLGMIFVFISSITMAGEPINFIYTGSIDLKKIQDKLTRKDIEGVQIVYTWRQLEKEKDKYLFNEIEKDLVYLNKLNKKLFIQIQDRFFTPKNKSVPDYLLNEKIYTGGLVPQYDRPGENKPITMGWVAEQWNPKVADRYKKLLAALAKQFDGRIYGINLPETAIDINQKRDKTGFSCDKYFNAEMNNILAAKQLFKKSFVVQYVNFWPCEYNNDHQYMKRMFSAAEKNGFGLGGPDVAPYRKGQMKNSYPFFHQYKNKLSIVAFAIQEPTLTYTNPKTKKPFTKEAFQTFADEYLGANILFWSVKSPWLNQKTK